MIEIKGKYDTAKIFSENYEYGAIEQIQTLLNQPISTDAHTRIMPDYHKGAGCTIGYTAILSDKVIPNLIGVDIGCRVLAVNIGKMEIDYQSLDDFIRNNIPHGNSVNQSLQTTVFSELYDGIYKVCKKLNIDAGRVFNAIGSLGSGNHHIEIGVDPKTNEKWVSIHSGSRNFGLQIAKYHQSIAEQQCKENIQEDITSYLMKFKPEDRQDAKRDYYENHHRIPKGLEYLEGGYKEDYLRDMRVAQMFAKLNCATMMDKIINFLKADVVWAVESVHNYIDFDDGIIRKGAISAYENEEVIIPLNMAAGCILGTGKSNPDWNYSAPHGAGRKHSRSKAKEEISLEEFQESMKGVWSSCVKESTLDEAPQAYKNWEDIVKDIEDTVDIDTIIKPVYNFKAN